ncbi:glycine betaine uptake BCCT transporter [Anaeropeptidivorans aminofermentans]|jgi:glycine betaine transporter|uniref:glycine betaine uptake BCCT transporter n=1 Tax=Anaeropeptidivorans aminofermentans TaxID=2934315 RepID=UPI0020258C86|nr:BCCT family transporter [Anaeropeptidivorans aminofermentans]
MDSSKKNKGNEVFFISLVIVLAISLMGIISPENLGGIADFLFAQITEKFGWYYLVVMFFFVAFMLFVAFSKYGSIRLGKDTDRPEYSYGSWFAMLFSAGMGIGIVFWGIAEPLNHYINPDGIAGATPEAANFSIFSSFFHWGIHPWANYCIVALPLAYMQFRKDKPGLISSIFIPLVGEEKIKGPIGKTIDIFAIFATVAGVATSLGLGVMQINSGLNFLFGIPQNMFVQTVIVIIVSVIFIWTAIAGIDKGIKFLSNMNIALCFFLVLVVFILGPTIPILNSFVNGLGQYISGFVSESLRISSTGDNTWINKWRIFYWAWWIAWAPFVGMFIARISKGRTIKEFILGVTIVPALGSCLWFAVFGTTGISMGPEIAEEAIKVTETAYFIIVQHLPFGGFLSLITVALLCTFFITSANSATFVLGMMASNGNLNPSNSMKFLWGVIQSMMALALMFAGGLSVLQTGSIVASFPLAIIMVFACFSLIKALKSEKI